MKPYPWNAQRAFPRRMNAAPTAKTIGWIALIIAGALSPIALLIAVYAIGMFKWANDTYTLRPAVMIIVGAVTSLLVGASPVTIIHDWYEAAGNATANGQSHGTVYALFALRALPWALMFAGASVYLFGFASNYRTRSYLQPIRTSPWMRVLARRNGKALSTGEVKNNWVGWGTVENDPLPWRGINKGRVIGRRMGSEFGHGAVVGGAGTGKTVFGFALTHTATAAGAAVIYVDFKGSQITEERLRTIAERTGVPFHCVGVGKELIDHSEGIDPLDWDGALHELSETIISSFTFPTGTGEHFTNLAKKIVPLQLEAWSLVGGADNETLYQFLERTTSSNALIDRLTPLRASDSETDRERYRSLVDRIGVLKAQDLSGLQANLSALVTMAGAIIGNRTHPNGYVSLRHIAAQGGIVYIGIPGSSSPSGVKMFGSLIIRNITALIGERQRMKQEGHPLRPVLAVVDEASQLGERATVVETLYQQAREGEIWAWMLTQDYSTWPESTQAQIQANSTTQVAFRIPSQTSAEAVTDKVGQGPTLTQMRQQSIRGGMVGAEQVTAGGEAREELSRDYVLTPEMLKSTPNRHAYVWMGDGGGYGSKRYLKRLKEDRDNNPWQLQFPLIKVVPPTYLTEPLTITSTTHTSASPTHTDEQPGRTPTYSMVAAASAAEPPTVDGPASDVDAFDGDLEWADDSEWESAPTPPDDEDLGLPDLGLPDFTEKP